MKPGKKSGIAILIGGPKMKEKEDEEMMEEEGDEGSMAIEDIGAELFDAIKGKDKQAFIDALAAFKDICS